MVCGEQCLEHRYASVVTLRAEVGTSNMLTKDLKTKVCYKKYLMENGNELLKETYMETMRVNMGEWSRTVREYRRPLDISEEKLRNISREEIKNEIRMRDSMRWEEEKESETTLEL